MKTLLLLRHAKSSWDDPRLDDFDRPLNPRGRRAAPRMGRWMRDEGWLPERVLCSAARRAIETWKEVEAVLDPESLPAVEVLRGLYLAEPERILELLGRHGGGAERVLVVGHNPGFHELARALAHGGDPAGLGELRRKFPTGALAILSFPVDGWGEVSTGSGRLERFVRPADLEGGG